MIDIHTARAESYRAARTKAEEAAQIVVDSIDNAVGWRWRSDSLIEVYAADGVHVAEVTIEEPQ